MTLSTNDAIVRFGENEERVNKFVNANGTYQTNEASPRQVETLPSFISRKDNEINERYSAFNSRGNWASATNYQANDLVVSDSIVYVCLITHTSAIFATDLAAKKWTVHQGATRQELASDSGSTLIGHKEAEDGAILKNVFSILRERIHINRFLTTAQIDNILAGTPDDITAAVNKARLASENRILNFGKGTFKFGNITFTAPVEIIGDGEGSTIFQKASNATMFKAFWGYVRFRNLKMTGSVDNSLGFIDTTDIVQIGQNDGANGQGTGYINATQCGFENVIITKAGRDGFNWQEGAFCKLEGLHVLESGRNNFHVSENAFDASHGLWFTSSAGSIADGYSINFGCHTFELAKSFSDGARGVFINNSRGSSGNFFVELSNDACLELGSDTLACEIALQFWTAGKNPIDNGIGNKITAQSLGNNNGGLFESFTRTNKMLIKREFSLNGESPLNGGLLIEQTSNTDFEIGDSSYACKMQAKSGGLVFKNTAIGHKTFDLSSFGLVNDLNSANQHIDNWLLQSGQTLRVNGASGITYVPYDGQTITIWLKGSGSISIYGQIAGSLQTINITETNGSLTLMWQAVQTSWFVKK